MAAAIPLGDIESAKEEINIDDIFIDTFIKIISIKNDTDAKLKVTA